MKTPVMTPLEAGQTAPGNKRRCFPSCWIIGWCLGVSCSLALFLWLTIFLINKSIYDLAALDTKPPEFKVESATLTQLNIEGPQLTATWDITLLNTNPGRRLESHYCGVEAAIQYGSTLVKQPVASFVLNQRRNQTRVGLRLGFLGQPGEQVVRGIADERNSKVVTFGVRLLAKVRFKKYPWTSRTQEPRGWLLVSCDNIGFEFSGKNETGEKTSQSGQCNVNYNPIDYFGKSDALLIII